MKKNILLTLVLLVFLYLSFAYSHDHAHTYINGIAFDQFAKDLPDKFKNYVIDESGNFILGGMAIIKPGMLYSDIEEGYKLFTFKDWIKHGGYSADEPELIMSLRHFYDPLKNAVDITSTGAKAHYLTDHVNALVNYLVTNYYKIEVDPKMDAKTWAISGPKYRNYKENSYSFSKGLEYLNLAFAETNLKHKEELFAAAWRALGETMHLISDMTVPAHVRNDAHPGATQLFTTLRGDPYERNVVNNHPEFDNVIEKTSTITCNKAIADKIKNVKTIDELFVEVSKFTNKNFCSIDTVSGIFPYGAIPKKFDLKDIKKLRIVYVTNNNYQPPYPEPDMEKLSFSKTPTTILTSPSLKDTAKYIGFYNGFPAVDLRWFGESWINKYCVYSNVPDIILTYTNLTNIYGKYPFKDISFLQAETLIPVAIESSKKVMEFFLPVIKVSLDEYDDKQKTITGKINITNDQYHKGKWIFNLGEYDNSDDWEPEVDPIPGSTVDIGKTQNNTVLYENVLASPDIPWVDDHHQNVWFRLVEVQDTHISEINPDKYHLEFDNNNIEICFKDDFLSNSEERQIGLDVNFGGFWVQSNILTCNENEEDNKEAMVTDIFELDFTFDRSQYAPFNYIYPNNRGYLKQTNDSLTVQVLYTKEIEPYTESFLIHDKDGDNLLDTFEIDIFPAKFNVTCGDEWKGSAYDGGVSLKRKTIEHSFDEGDEKIESTITGEFNIKFVDDSRIRNVTDVETYVNDYVRPYDKIIPIQISDFKGFALTPKEPFARGRWGAHSGYTAAGYNNYIEGFVIKGHQAISIKAEVYGSSTYNNKDKEWFIGQGDLTMKEIKSILSSITLTPDGTIIFNDTKEEYLFDLTPASDAIEADNPDQTSSSTVDAEKVQNSSAVNYENKVSYTEIIPITLLMNQTNFNNYFETFPRQNSLQNDIIFDSDALRVNLPNGRYNSESGIKSIAPVITFDESLDENPQIIELEFIPELSKNFIIALANIDYILSDTSLRNYESTWIQYRSQRNSNSTNLSLFNSLGLDEIVERNWNGLKTPETITLTLYRNRIMVEDSLGNHLEKTIPWVRNGVTARLFIFASNDSEAENTGFALKKISISNSDNQIGVRELKTRSLKVLPLFTDTFDTFNRQNWVRYQDCSVNLDRYYLIKNGVLDISVPSGNEWAKAGIRSRNELFSIPPSGESKTIVIKFKEDHFHSYAIILSNTGVSGSLSDTDNLTFSFITNPLSGGNLISLYNSNGYHSVSEKHLSQNHSIVNNEIIFEISERKARIYTTWGDILEENFEWMRAGVPVYLYLIAQSHDESLPAHLAVDVITVY